MADAEGQKRKARHAFEESLEAMAAQ